MSFSTRSRSPLPTNNRRIYQLFLNMSPLTDRFAREFATDIIPSRGSGTIWRAYVYQRRLYAIPLRDITGRTRDISARFYRYVFCYKHKEISNIKKFFFYIFRENPAQLHRLMPWLNREIIWILDPSTHLYSSTERQLQELLCTHDMTSRAFRANILGYFNGYTSHFIHELINFARSPYDMIGYDRNVQYQPYYEEEVESIHSSDESNTFSDYLLSDNSQQAAMELDRFLQTTLDNTASSVIVYNNSGSTSNATATGQQSTSSAPPIEVVIDSDDSDECLFVCELKAPHLRTPEMVELNSDTDSDVMVVEENSVKSEPKPEGQEEHTSPQSPEPDIDPTQFLEQHSQELTVEIDQQTDDKSSICIGSVHRDNIKSNRKKRVFMCDTDSDNSWSANANYQIKQKRERPTTKRSIPTSTVISSNSSNEIPNSQASSINCAASTSTSSPLMYTSVIRKHCYRRPKSLLEDLYKDSSTDSEASSGSSVSSSESSHEEFNKTKRSKRTSSKLKLKSKKRKSSSSRPTRKRTAPPKRKHKKKTKKFSDSSSSSSSSSDSVSSHDYFCLNL